MQSPIASRSAPLSATPTRLRGLPSRWAAVVLVIIGLAMIILVGVAVQPLPVDSVAAPGEGDMAIYTGVIAALRHGRDYYPTLHAALLQGGYGTESVFNWRPPLYLWLVSSLPSVMWAEAVFSAMALAAAIGLFVLWRRAGGLIAASIGAATIVFGAIPDALSGILFSEVAAGILILVSVVGYAHRLIVTGVLAGAAALFVRELAGPYVLVCCYFAWRGGRRRELAMWAAVLAGYAVYYGWHYAMVRAQLGPLDVAPAESWLQWGGAGFVLRTASFSGQLVMAPLWMTAILLPLAILGLVACPGPGARRSLSTVFVYMALFSIAGKPSNTYWGMLYTPLLWLGLAWVPRALRDLLDSIAPWRRSGAA